MHHGQCANLAGAALLAACMSLAAAENATPAPQNVVVARIALRFKPETRCPEVRPAGADDAGVAVVLFHVGTTGVPSRASIRSSSQSAALDAAAVNCVLKLRFQPATTLGDGAAVESWQQMGWAWRNAAASPDSSAATAPAAATPHGAAPASAVAAPSGTSRAPRDGAEVRACTDAAGRLLQDPTIVHSSGDTALDAAAVSIARSGSAYYRPAAGADGRPVSGCVDLAVRFESP